MNEDNIFTVLYDDHPDEVVYRISSILKNFNLRIEELDGEDGSQDYKIVKIKDSE